MDNLDKQELATGVATKRCPRCGEVKPLSEYYEKLLKTVTQCKVCRREMGREQYWRKRPPGTKSRFSGTPEEVKQRARERAYKRRLGITLEERDAMLAAQGGVCLICGSDSPHGPTWCTDHDHSCCPNKDKVCGKCIRGVLCFRCNTLLGHAKDNIETLRSAIEYLENWERQRG